MADEFHERFPMPGAQEQSSHAVVSKYLIHRGFQTRRLPSPSSVDQSKLFPGVWPLLNANSF